MKNPNPTPRFKRTSAARRARLLAAFDRSAMSAAAFARQHQLNYTTFCGWRQQRAKASPEFVQVEVSQPPGSAGLVIEMGSEARMRIDSADQIGLAAAFVRHLNSPRPC
jgi:hypothetical protein